MSEQNNQTLEQQYPSIELAYPIAIASYDVAAKRLDTIDGRLQTIMAFIVTVSAAVPSIASGRGVHFRSYWFYTSITLFIVSIGLGTYARLTGRLQVLKPSHLYQEWLGEDPWLFKKDVIYYAAKDFDANLDLVDFKWRCSVAITLLFFLEVVCLTVWVLFHHS